MDGSDGGPNYQPDRYRTRAQEEAKFNFKFISLFTTFNSIDSVINGLKPHHDMRTGNSFIWVRYNCTHGTKEPYISGF